MIRVVIFDSDGMLSHGPRFSDTYAREKRVPLELLTPFFVGPFKNCLVGKTDLKEELQKGWLEKWGWQGSVDEFLAYWFSVGDMLDEQVYSSIAQLRTKGIICVLATNQDKYRTEYLTTKFKYDVAFSKVYSSAFVGSKKPSPEFFTTIFSELSESVPNLKKDEVLFWDDDIENVEGAASFGLATRQFKDGPSYKAEMKKLGLL